MRLSSSGLLACLALSIGSGSFLSLSAITDQVLLSPSTFKGAERLTLIWQGPIGLTGLFSGINLDYLRSRFPVLRSSVAFCFGGEILRREGTRTELRSVEVEPGAFQFFRGGPVTGRAFAPSESGGTEEMPVVLSYSFWQSHFGSSSSVIGQPLTLEDHPARVIGVAQPAMGRFFALWGGEPDLFTPIRKGLLWRSREHPKYFVMVQRPPRVSLADISENLHLLQADFRELDTENRAARLLATSVNAYLLAPWMPALRSWFAGAALLLLLGIINAALLQLARAVERQHEFALRIALGARSRDLFGRAIKGSLALSVLGIGSGVALAGVLLHYAQISLLPAMNTSVSARLRIDWRTIVFAIALAGATGLAAALAPAIVSTRADPGVLLARGPNLTLWRGRNRLQLNLIATQVGVAVLLLSAAALLAGYIYTAQHQRIDRLYGGVVAVYAYYRPAKDYGALGENWRSAYAADMKAYYSPLFDWVCGSGRRCAGIYPAPWQPRGPGVLLDGPGGRHLSAMPFAVTGSYFRFSHVAVIDGRTCAASDFDLNPTRVLINRAFVRAFAPDTPFDKVFTAERDGDRYKVIGVVADAVDTRDDPTAPPTLYRCQNGNAWYLLARAGDGRRNPAALGAYLESGLRSRAPELEWPNVLVPAEIEDAELRKPQVQAWLLTIFAGIANTLALIGVYSLGRHYLARWRRTLAIRASLGASSLRLAALVLQRMLPAISIAAVAGFLLAAGLAHWAELAWNLPQLNRLTVLIPSAAIVITLAMLALLIPLFLTLQRPIAAYLREQ